MFAISDEIKKKSISPERKAFIKTLLQQDAEIDELLDSTNSKIQQAVKASSRDGKITRSAKLKVLIAGALATFTVKYKDILLRNNIKVAEDVGSFMVAKIAKKYKDVAFTEIATQLSKENVNYLAKNFFKQSLFEDGITLGTRIKTIETMYFRTVQDILKVGIAEGSSAAMIAREIDNIIKPTGDAKWISPFEWYRTRFGYKVSRPVTARLSGSVSYQSFRIARTEINNNYRVSTIRSSMDSPWKKAYKWHLSASHPKKDICDDYNNKTFADESKLPNTHPNCMCWVEVVLK